MCAASRRRHLFVLVIILCVTVIVSSGLAGLAELTIRHRMDRKYGFTDFDEIQMEHPRVPGLIVVRPHLKAGPIESNALGFRGPELTIPKPDGTVRIAFLGASTTFCAEVSTNEHTWPHLVWAAISKAWPDATVDYANAAYSGYRLEQIQQVLEHLISPTEPDLVVYYEATNELSYDVRRLAEAQGLYRGESIWLQWLSDHSRLIEIVWKNLAIGFRSFSPGRPEGKLHVDPVVLSRGFEGRLRKFVAAAKARSKLVVLVTFATRVRRSVPEDERPAAMITAAYYIPSLSTDAMIAAFEEYNRVIRQVAKDTGALLVEAADAVPPDRLHYVDSVHFTDLGAAVMAEQVSRSLLAAPEFSRLLSRSTRRFTVALR